MNAAPTFFARPAFGMALADVFAHLEAQPYEVALRGRRYTVPLVRSVTTLGLRHATAFPFGAYSCVLDERAQPADAATAGEVLACARRDFDSFEFTAWPLGDQPALAQASVTLLKTAVVNCGDGRTAALSSMRGVTRRMAAQAIRRGVSCERSPATAEAIDQYYTMLEEASAGWGLREPTISRALLRAVFARGGDDAELWFARLDGHAIAGGVVLCGSQELFFWSAAMRRDFARYRPSNALNVRLIERACERGVRWYNLGASEGLEGVERFKHDLGARDVVYRRMRYQGRVASIYSGFRRALRGEVLRA